MSPSPPSPSSSSQNSQSPNGPLSSPITEYFVSSSIALPPPSPLPWLWTCHHCCRRYNVAVTRRCLACGHHFCLWRVPRYNNDQIHDRNVCVIEFDYAGWKAWMEWRREIACLKAHVQTTKNTVEVEEKARDQNDTDSHEGTQNGRGPKKHDCSIDCDYPSQCLHERYAALKEYLADKQGSPRELEQAWEDMESDMVLYADGNEYD